jgi:type II secretion system protein H
MTRRALQRRRRAGFTLIELIVVMMLMAVMLAVAAPQLTGFMAGRGVLEEGRRLLALTRFAQNEAVAQGEPMQLWIRPETGEYGIRPASPLAMLDEADTMNFTCEKSLSLEAPPESLTEAGEAILLFLPDGMIDEASVSPIYLIETGEPILSLVLSENRMQYETEDLRNAAI